MSLSLYLPLAGNSINILLLLGLGGAVGFLSGLFGVGGGFLMTPLLIMVGIPSTVAAASDSNQIVAASTSGTYAHYRLGNVDFKMGIILIVGGVLGGTMGVYLIKALRALGNADFVIKITYVVMLGVIGLVQGLPYILGSFWKGQSVSVRFLADSRSFRFEDTQGALIKILPALGLEKEHLIGSIPAHFPLPAGFQFALPLPGV